MDFKKVAYWIITILMCALFMFSATMYFMNTEMIQGMFVKYGYPGAIVIPLAIAKVLGVIAVLTDKSKLLTMLAYGGFMVDVILATIAHVLVDNAYQFSITGIVLVFLSWLLYRFRYSSVEQA